MKLKPINLNENDIKLLKFLARYKLMNASDAIKIYKTSYYQKRLQELKNANYITRYYKVYIKLSLAGMRYLESLNIKCQIPCRNKNYIERLCLLSKIGIDMLDENIDIKLSYEMKNEIYTDWSRRFLGELKLRDNTYLLYYAKNDLKYVRGLQFDINKDFEYENVLVFTNNLNIIGIKSQFIFSNKSSCLVIDKERIPKLAAFNKINIKQEIEKIYKARALESDYNVSDYKVENTSITYMPFIDTHRILAINNFYSLDLTNDRIEILTLKENITMVERLLSNIASKYVTVKEISLDGGKNEGF